MSEFVGDCRTCQIRPAFQEGDAGRAGVDPACLVESDVDRPRFPSGYKKPLPWEGGRVECVPDYLPVFFGAPVKDQKV